MRSTKLALLNLDAGSSTLIAPGQGRIGPQPHQKTSDTCVHMNDVSAEVAELVER